jgi:hypothetical protein
MASNIRKGDNRTEDFNHHRLLEMGVTPDQRSQCKAQLSNTTSSNEQVFGEDFEYTVSLFINIDIDFKI